MAKKYIEGTRIEDITGNKYGKLTVTGFSHRNKNYRYYWKCKCDCGNEKIVERSQLKNEKTKSCGCLVKERATEANITHGMSGTKIYKIWYGMKTRCYNSVSPKYKNYGARGIEICDEWLNSFETFYIWSMDNGYKEGLTIDRIDVNGNYEPSNCRWVDNKVQANNKTNNVYIIYNNKTQTLIQWCEELGLEPGKIYLRYERNPNISPEELFNTEINNKILITYRNKTQSIRKWCKDLNLNYVTICSRYRNNPNISLEDLFSSKNQKAILMTHKGKTQNLTQWCNELNLNYEAIKARYKKNPNISPEELFKPIRKR